MNRDKVFWLGIVSAVVMIIATLIPWTYHADVQKNFTGFFSEGNHYGSPGKYLMIFAAFSLFATLMHYLWAKRVNLFITAFAVGYSIKSYILFTSCYKAYCPEKKLGIFLIVIASIGMLIASAMSKRKDIKQP